MLKYNKLYICFFLFILFICSTEIFVSASPFFQKKSFLNSNRCVKIVSKNRGIHRITYDWLRNNGFSHPENVKVFGGRNEKIPEKNSLSFDNQPVQVPVCHYKDPTGVESLLLYLPGSVKWDPDLEKKKFIHQLNQYALSSSFFFLSEELSESLNEIKTEPALTVSPSETVLTFDDFEVEENENFNLIESGSLWFSTLINGNSNYQKRFQFTNRLINEPVFIDISAAARSSINTRIDLKLNNQSLGSLSYSPIGSASSSDFALLQSRTFQVVTDNNFLDVQCSFVGSASSQCWIDYIRVQVRRNLQYNNEPLLFRDLRSVGSGKVVKFQIEGVNSGLKLWKVSDPFKINEINYNRSGSQLSFTANADSLQTYLLFDPFQQYPGFSSLGEVKGSFLRELPVPDMVVVTNQLFIGEAERLATYHRNNDQLAVTVVDVEEIYNEFGGGFSDVASIRNFLRYLYDKQGSQHEKLKYLLLFGKGTYDMVHEPTAKNPDFVPSYQSLNALSPIDSYVSDDFFGFLDEDEGENGQIDLGIGRIPATTTNEAHISVDKIIHYSDPTTLGSWRNNLTFIGDDGDQSIHTRDSELISELIGQNYPVFSSKKIYLDAYSPILEPEKRYPAVNEEIRKTIEKGTLIVNYIGHASEDGLAHERVLTEIDINQMSNNNLLPLFVTATCEFGRWDMSSKRSAGEKLLFHTNGGSIALLSTTRLVYSSSNFAINLSFFNHLADKDPQGKYLRLGDLVRKVKIDNSGSINTLKFSLLGDPAIRLNIPEYQVRNIEINGESLNGEIKPFHPLQKVSIKGEVQDQKGIKANNFDGILTAIVYDQPVTKRTLGNGGEIPFEYKVTENILFKGEASVRKGEFSYSFVVPEEISYQPGKGLVQYYVQNSFSDGNGSSPGLVFNGEGVVSAYDHNGPQIKIFLENENFNNGDPVSINPLLIVNLTDESGINAMGSGIGHDITMVLDNKNENKLVLNGYYIAAKDSWQNGSIYYQLKGLKEGNHTLTIKVWDIAGNSSTSEISFFVSADFKIETLYNFPNPFKDQTLFVLLHNNYGSLLRVNLEIFDSSGKKIFSDQNEQISDGYQLNNLYWRPDKVNGLLPAGIYLYRISLQNDTGQKTEKVGKMILSR